MNLLDSTPSFRKAMLTRLAFLADEGLHRSIADSSAPSFSVDLSDAFEFWDDGPSDEGIQDESLSPEELGWLNEFDEFLNAHYGSQPGFPEADAWSWLYAKECHPSAIWLETTRRSRELLTRFPDFDLQAWRDAGYRMW